MNEPSDWQRFEHFVDFVTPSPVRGKAQTFADGLRSMEKLGYELVQIVPDGASFLFIYKRPTPPPPAPAREAGA